MEDAPPGVEPEHRDVCVGGVPCVEGSPEHGAGAEKCERVGGHHPAPQARHTIARQHDSGQAGHGNRIRQRRRARAPLQKIWIGDAALSHAAGRAWNVLDQSNKTVAPGERKRLQQDRVHDTVDRRRRSDAQSKRDDGDSREARRPPQRPDRVANGLHRYGWATKFAVTSMCTSTGVQFRYVGLNSHCRTASVAPLPRSGSPDETCTSRTVPSMPMSTSRITTPPTFAASRFSGYRGLTSAILVGARILPPTPLAAAPFPPQRSATFCILFSAHSRAFVRDSGSGLYAGPPLVIEMVSCRPPTRSWI